MDIYHIWFNLKPGESDLEFAGHMKTFLDDMKERGLIAGWRLTRQKLGFYPDALREFHVMIETDGMAQLDAAFNLMSERVEPSESKHFAVNSRVTDVYAALYRDFPDANRVSGQEKF